MPEHKFELCLLKNGGVVSYSLVGAGSRKAIFFHGHPGSRHQVQFIENYCAEEDLEVLSFDRPGYGNSSPQERSKNFLDLSEHIAALADSQGWKKFHLIAVSGGVPFALNCAATLKKRVLSAQLVCGLGPLHEREVRTHFSSRLYHVMKLARWMPSPVLNSLVHARLSSLWAPRQRKAKCPDFLSQSDFDLIRSPDIRPKLRLSLESAFRQGVQGAKRDLNAYLSAWNLDWREIGCPTTFWHGLEDKLVPWQFSKILADRIPSALYIPCEGEGHYTLPIHRARDILRAIR